MTTVAVRFRLEPEMLDLVDEHAKRERRSRAKLVRMIVEDWLMDKVDPDPDLDPAYGRTPHGELIGHDHGPRQTTDEFAARQPAGSMLVDTGASYKLDDIPGPSTPPDTRAEYDAEAP